ncbi:hypothetical protein LCGC14_0417920 [marine sediment metagenome]|uniref:Uncharacterized protein n=1 Tax=marine sediment metagenome TaxID=412755 RepID=A0A0F9VDS0_9ZZZZ
MNEQIKKEAWKRFWALFPDGFVYDEVREKFKRFISRELDKAIELQKKKDAEIARERLIIAYRNGIIDGKQNTNCEKVVVAQGVKAIESQNEN